MQKVNFNNYIDNLFYQNDFRRIIPNITWKQASNLFWRIGNALTCNKYETEQVLKQVQTLIAWSLCLPELGTQKSFSLNKGWLLIGSTGTGKTITCQILQHFFKLANVRYSNAAQIKTYFNHETQQDEKKIVHNELPLELMQIKDARQLVAEYTTEGQPIIDNYIKCCCLCIDDIGTEEEGNFYGTKKNVIAEILAGREQAHRLTFATSNLTNFADKYDDRTISRMQSLFNVLVFDNVKDFRTETC